MSSVQELLLAAQAKSRARSPFIGMMEGLTQGFGQGMQEAPARQRQMMALQNDQEERARRAENDKMIRSQIDNGTEGATLTAFNGVAAMGKPAHPGMRLAGASVGENGYLTPKFDVLTPKPKALSPREYTDASGQVRQGLFDANAAPGQNYITSPSDPLAVRSGGGMGGMNASPSDEQVDAVAKDFAAGSIPAKDFGQLIGRSSPVDRYRLYGAIKKFNPDFNMADVSMKFAKEIASATSTGRTQGGKGFEIASNVGSLDDTLRQMEPLVSKLSPTSMQALNNAWQKGLAQTNDADANQVLALANSARGLYSQVIAGGAGTVESDKKSNETIARGLSPEGFKGMKAAVLAEGYSRSGRMTGQIKNVAERPAGYIDPNGTSAPAGAHAALLDKYGEP